MTERSHLSTLAALIHEPICRSLVNAAEETPCHLVGGYLRDRLLGLASRDLDVVVGGGAGGRMARQLADSLPARCVDLGRNQFEAYRLVGSELTIDLWDRQSMSLIDDLRRRDFTLNSFALDLRDGKVQDPCNGLGDLDRKLLRATTPDSFTEDPLRILRLPRLAALLPAFSVDDETLRWARSALNLLPGVATERIREELRLLFDQVDFQRGFSLLQEIGVLPQLWSVSGDRQHGPGATDELLGRLERRRAELETGRNFQASRETRDVDLATARWAVLFDHSAAAPGDSARAIHRGREMGLITRRERDRIVAFSEAVELPTDELSERRFLHRFGPDWPTALVVAGVHRPSTVWSSVAASLSHRAAVEGPDLFHLPRLVDGRDVARVLGIPTGPAIGATLSQIESLQVAGRLRSRSRALAWLAARRPRTGSS